MKGACNGCFCRALLRVPEVGAERFLPSSCRCRSVFLVVYLMAGAFPAVRGGVTEETTVERLAVAHGCCGGRLWSFATRWLFYVCGRRLVCADAWPKRPPWLLLPVTVAVCSRCSDLPSAVPCVCVRGLLLGLTVAGMVPLTVDG
ncbi:trans-sialidase [Trypanosoma cruzi cruzi]|nr:trans-sialidase [Trypanosoma cruzi cruzi]